MHTTHGHTLKHKRTPTYYTWEAMRMRCNNHNSSQYPRYGAQGVKVCQRWNSFENFLADMGERPTGKTLDRYPNSKGDYEPSNCRWATWKEQIRNSGVVRLVAVNGIPTIYKDAGELFGIHNSTISLRLRRGWGIGWALMCPVISRKKKG